MHWSYWFGRVARGLLIIVPLALIAVLAALLVAG
ncbi:hypothetical protein ASALC70_02596 [Alcanivorax sp. ALC70]|nr:hypothetical protein ASALC70_02596 [Alcanivorax sp. ALC70]|tara:strand:+ start:441 stop:542 length:102 start_codon:yes stop_codon:yes gene_type:complete